MKLVFISDTHIEHLNYPIEIPDGDILIHCGDATYIGDKYQLLLFNEWFSSLPHKYKIFCPGNHDIGFDYDLAPKYIDPQEVLSSNIIYLQDSGCTIEHNNQKLKIHASPRTPMFFNWAFMHHGNEIQKYWDMIPENLDVLVTHGPPYGILDKTLEGKNVGCPFLLEEVKKKKPKIHAFGHVHEGYGIQKEETTFINAAICNRDYFPENKPIVVEL